jgi:hypothetical protein
MSDHAALDAASNPLPLTARERQILRIIQAYSASRPNAMFPYERHPGFREIALRAGIYVNATQLPTQAYTPDRVADPSVSLLAMSTNTATKFVTPNDDVAGLSIRPPAPGAARGAPAGAAAETQADAAALRAHVPPGADQTALPAYGAPAILPGAPAPPSDNPSDILAGITNPDKPPAQPTANPDPPAKSPPRTGGGWRWGSGWSWTGEADSATIGPSAINTLPATTLRSAGMLAAAPLGAPLSGAPGAPMAPPAGAPPPGGLQPLTPQDAPAGTPAGPAQPTPNPQPGAPGMPSAAGGEQAASASPDQAANLSEAWLKALQSGGVPSTDPARGNYAGLLKLKENLEYGIAYAKPGAGLTQIGITIERAFHHSASARTQILEETAWAYIEYYATMFEAHLSGAKFTRVCIELIQDAAAPDRPAGIVVGLDNLAYVDFNGAPLSGAQLADAQSRHTAPSAGSTAVTVLVAQRMVIEDRARGSELDWTCDATAADIQTMLDAVNKCLEQAQMLADLAARPFPEAQRRAFGASLWAETAIYNDAYQEGYLSQSQQLSWSGTIVAVGGIITGAALAAVAVKFAAIPIGLKVGAYLLGASAPLMLGQIMDSEIFGQLDYLTSKHSYLVELAASRFVSGKALDLVADELRSRPDLLANYASPASLLLESYRGMERLRQAQAGRAFRGYNSSVTENPPDPATMSRIDLIARAPAFRFSVGVNYAVWAARARILGYGPEDPKTFYTFAQFLGARGNLRTTHRAIEWPRGLPTGSQGGIPARRTLDPARDFYAADADTYNLDRSPFAVGPELQPKPTLCGYCVGSLEVDFLNASLGDDPIIPRQMRTAGFNPALKLLVTTCYPGMGYTPESCGRSIEQLRASPWGYSIGVDRNTPFGDTSGASKDAPASGAPPNPLLPGGGAAGGTGITGGGGDGGGAPPPNSGALPAGVSARTHFDTVKAGLVANNQLSRILYDYFVSLNKVPAPPSDSAAMTGGVVPGAPVTGAPASIPDDAVAIERALARIQEQRAALGAKYYMGTAESLDPRITALGAARKPAAYTNPLFQPDGDKRNRGPTRDNPMYNARLLMEEHNLRSALKWDASEALALEHCPPKLSHNYASEAIGRAVMAAQKRTIAHFRPALVKFEMSDTAVTTERFHPLTADTTQVKRLRRMMQPPAQYNFADGAFAHPETLVTRLSGAEQCVPLLSAAMDPTKLLSFYLGRDLRHDEAVHMSHNSSNQPPPTQ